MDKLKSVKWRDISPRACNCIALKRYLYIKLKRIKRVFVEVVRKQTHFSLSYFTWNGTICFGNLEDKHRLEHRFTNKLSAPYGGNIPGGCACTWSTHARYVHHCVHEYDCMHWEVKCMSILKSSLVFGKKSLYLNFTHTKSLNFIYYSLLEQVNFNSQNVKH